MLHPGGEAMGDVAAHVVVAAHRVVR
jgi:hypothetical protein